MRYRLTFLFIALQHLVLAAPAHAQLQNATGDVATPIPGAGHDYIHSFSETVSPANGSLSIRIDLPTPPGRKITVPFALIYNSAGINQPYYNPGLQKPQWRDFATQQTGTGWVYSIPSLTALEYVKSGATYTDPPVSWSCNWISNYMFQAMDSTREHPPIEERSLDFARDDESQERNGDW